MSSPKVETHEIRETMTGGTICNPVVTILKNKKDKTFWPNAIVYVPLDQGSLPLCDSPSVTWVLQADPGASVRYEILKSPVFVLQGIPVKGTLDAKHPTLTIPLDTGDAGAGAVVFSGSDPATSVVIVE